AASRPAGAPPVSSSVNGAAATESAPAAADPAPPVEAAAPAEKAPEADKPADKAAEKPADKAAEKPAEKPAEKAAEKPAEKAADGPAPAQTDNGAAPAAEAATETAEPAAPSRRSRQSRRNRAEQQAEQAQQQSQPQVEATAAAPEEQRDGARDGAEARPDTRREGGRGERGGRGDRPDNRTDTRTDTRGPRDNRPDDDGGEEEAEGRGRRGRRFRDRRRNRDRDRGQNNVDTEVRDGDVLLPVAGIVDILDNYAFVRTTGYLSGPTDVYVSMSMVRKYGLRRGDAITGAVREPREGEQSRQKFNPLVRVDTINGQDPETAKHRPEFHKLTPLYPNERLRLETEPHKLTTRVIDLVMPVGKGQRALIVSPPKAGKTTIMQAIANA